MILWTVGVGSPINAYIDTDAPVDSGEGLTIRAFI